MAEEWARVWDFKQTDFSALALQTERHTQLLKLVSNLEARALRVRFSNVDGLAPLSFSSVTARSTGDHSSEPIPVLVGGHAQIVVAAGAEIDSDPIELQLGPTDDLQIEARIDGSTSIGNLALLVNSSLVALETEGPTLTARSTEAPQLTDILGYVGTLYGIKRVELLARPAKHLVFFGDSITQSGVWTDPVAVALYSRQPGGIFAINNGLGGRRLLQDSPAEAFGLFGTAAVNGFEEEVFAAGAPSLVVVQIGVNDLCHPTTYNHPHEIVSAGQMQAGLAALARYCSERGVPVVCCTILPFGGNPAWTEKGENIRQEVNTWIRSNPVFDGVLDFDAAARDHSDPTRLAAEYHVGDWLHPSPAGGARIAEAVPIDLLVGLINR